MSEAELDKSTLARVDERTKSIQAELVQIRLDLKEAVESLGDRTRDTERDIKQLEKDVEQKYVTKVEFEFIKKVFYGAVTAVLGTVLVAVISLVIVPAAKHQAGIPASAVSSSSK